MVVGNAVDDPRCSRLWREEHLFVSEVQTIRPRAIDLHDAIAIGSRRHGASIMDLGSSHRRGEGHHPDSRCLR